MQKNIGHRARSRAEDTRSSSTGAWIVKQCRVLGMCARLFTLLRDFYAQ